MKNGTQKILYIMSENAPKCHENLVYVSKYFKMEIFRRSFE